MPGINANACQQPILKEVFKLDSVKSKSKLITKGKSIKTVEEVGTKIQSAVSAFFDKQNKKKHDFFN